MKKKCKYLLMLVAMLLLSLPVQAQGGLRPRGDVNCDWEVNIADVNVLIEDIFTDLPYHSLYTYAHDINSDKEINIADLNMLIGGILGDELQPMPSYSGTLPVMYINTEGYQDIVSKEEYLHANWWIDAKNIDGMESIGSAAAPLGMQIKGRGNSTWKEFDKKPFRLKLDEKQPVLGMPSNRHWVLLANAHYWKGEINDALPWEIGRRMGMAWNPRFEPVEVVLNGQYLGMFFLAEKIVVGKNRVNIIEQDDRETNAGKVTGGWLLEIDNYPESNSFIIHNAPGKYARITYHSPEDLSEVQKNYIIDFMNKTDLAILSDDVTDTVWEQYIDIDALAIFYIVQEITDNVEAFAGSCYMYKERGEDTKLVFGPLWDGGSVYIRWSPDYPFNEFIYENVPSYSDMKWIEDIAKFDHFQERVRYHWQRFYEEVYPQMDDFLDTFAAKIEQAGNCDYKRWGQFGADNITERLNLYGRPSFHKKVGWLNSQWGTGN